MKPQQASILIVDDDPAMRLLIRSALEKDDYRVEEAENGEDALALFEQITPDIVLLDVVMPGMNGFDVCSALRAMPTGRHVPILMVTGMDDIDSITCAYEMGATDFLNKPINWLILRERVRYMWRASQTVNQLRKSEASLATAQRIARLGSWELDRATKEFRCSDETQSICGLSINGDRLDYHNFMSVVHPHDLDLVLNTIQQASTEGESARLDHRIVLPNGEERVVFQQIEPLCDNCGQTVQIAGTIQDITERKMAERLEIDRNQVLEMVIRGEPLKDILLQLVEMVEHQRPDVLCAISLLRGNRLCLGAAPRLPEDFARAVDGQEVGPRTGCCGSAAYFGETVLATDLANSPLWNTHREVAVRNALGACFSLPIVSGKGQILGTVAIYHHQPSRPNDGELELLGSVGKLAAIAMEQRQLNERLLHQAHHDALTGLPNRMLLADRLEHAMARALRYAGKVALIYIDLDRFKQVNDSLGHHVGDLLLKEVAGRLQNCTRKSDTLARMGGDEFMLVVNGFTHRDSPANMARRLLDLFHQPCHLEGRDLHITASIGISICPDDGEDAVTLQRNADIAMYYAKNRGGNRYHFYTEPMKATVIERLEIENDLRKALERNEFELHYQPQYELCETRLIGVEALIRWNHPEIGLIPPGKFIPVAEETGLILPIGLWVLREACRRNAAWQRAGCRPFKVAVNVSAIQFLQEDFVAGVADALGTSGLAPQWLELEVTESVLMKDLKAVANRLAEIRELGVSIAIDDFGNGYSSMAYLQQLPVDCLKIDRSFIQDIASIGSSAQRARTLVKAFVSLAENMGLKLLAEGVENAEQFNFLKEIGCELGQGFLLNVPMSATEIESLCDRGLPFVRPVEKR